MSKPIIGVMPLWDDDKESMWMLPGYFDGIKQAGGIPIMFPFTSDEDEIDQLMTMCNGILFTGGHDVCPSLYGEEELSGVSCCEARDNMETIVLQKVIEKNIPTLGISSTQLSAALFIRIFRHNSHQIQNTIRCRLMMFRYTLSIS